MKKCSYLSIFCLAILAAISTADCAEIKEERSYCSTEHTAQAIAFLNDLLDNRTPLGYEKRSLTEADEREPFFHLEISPIKAFDGPADTVVVYWITNQGSFIADLSSKEFKRLGDSWVFLQKKELSAFETTMCIVGRPKK